MFIIKKTWQLETYAYNRAPKYMKPSLKPKLKKKYLPWKIFISSFTPLSVVSFFVLNSNSNWKTLEHEVIFIKEFLFIHPIKKDI